MTVPHVLSIVTLGVADVAASVTFYQALGWSKASSSTAEIAWFDLGGPWLGLFGTDDLAIDAGFEPPGSGVGGFDRVTLALNLPDEAAVDAALALAAAAGGSLRKAGTRMDWGGYSGYFADPDGHLWEVAHNPMFPIRDDGRIVIP
jgi:catechol 2,3-dioxygenase-like lactoylglutathione lyase family enzyme